jgi:hypothetical protein
MFLITFSLPGSVLLQEANELLPEYILFGHNLILLEGVMCAKQYGDPKRTDTRLHKWEDSFDKELTFPTRQKELWRWYYGLF